MGIMNFFKSAGKAEPVKNVDKPTVYTISAYNNKTKRNEDKIVDKDTYGLFLSSQHSVREEKRHIREKITRIQIQEDLMLKAFNERADVSLLVSLSKEAHAYHSKRIHELELQLIGVEEKLYEIFRSIPVYNQNTIDS